MKDIESVLSYFRETITAFQEEISFYSTTEDALKNADDIQGMAFSLENLGWQPKGLTEDNPHRKYIQTFHFMHSAPDDTDTDQLLAIDGKMARHADQLVAKMLEDYRNFDSCSYDLIRYLDPDSFDFLLVRYQKSQSVIGLRGEVEFVTTGNFDLDPELWQ